LILPTLLAEMPVTFYFMAAGVLAVFLNSGNKRAICLIYVIGLLIEEAVYQWFTYLGIFGIYWDFFYSTIVLVDLLVIGLMIDYWHRDYEPVYYLIFSMILINASIIPEWVWMDSTVVLDMSERALHALNIALLFILYGKSDGIIRILGSIRAGLFRYRYKPAINFLRVYTPRRSHTPEKV